MTVGKALITAAARSQRQLPLQTVVDRDGATRSVLEMLVREAQSAGVEEVGVVIAPEDRAAYAMAVSSTAVQFIPQPQPLGYGDAILCARKFLGDEPFLHFVGDHLFLSRSNVSCAKQLVQIAVREQCSVSGVQATREQALPFYGTIGGRRVAGQTGLYEVENVIEKPTPTVAEQSLIVPGLRAGHYLCFLGMHVLTPGVLDVLEELRSTRPTLSDGLARLTRRERFLALEVNAARYNVGVKYGLLIAQLALVLGGPDRDELLTQMLELLANSAKGQ